MAKVLPTNSKLSDVYHDNDLCTERNNIEPENVQDGTGGKQKCKACERLDVEDLKKSFGKNSPVPRSGRRGYFWGLRIYHIDIPDQVKYPVSGGVI